MQSFSPKPPNNVFTFPAAEGVPAQQGPPWLCPKYTVVTQLSANPDPYAAKPADYYMAGSMVKLPSGRLLVAMSKGKRTAEHSGLVAQVICASDDDGVSWQQQGEFPYDSTEPVLFTRDQSVYLFLTPNRISRERGSYFNHQDGGRIWLCESRDEGRTWSEPVCIVRGQADYTSGGHAAWHMRAGRLYATISDRYRALAVICCDLGRGVMNPDAWRVSELVTMPIPPELIHGEYRDGSRMLCLEGNVLDIGGRLMVIARAQINRNSTVNMGAVYEIHDDDTNLKLEFIQLYPIPGGQCKFYIQHDAPSQLYWMASNLPSNAKGWVRHDAYPEDAGGYERLESGRGSLREDRRLLWLWYSLDALHWIPAGWIAKADHWVQSFMYPVMVIDGDDLLVMCRSARESGDMHDVDLSTFHRIRNFRQYAVDLRMRF